MRLGPFLDVDRCPHCGIARPSLAEKAQIQTQPAGRSTVLYWKIYACGSCGDCVIAAADALNGVVTQAYPEAIAVHADIPERAREYLQQAIDSLHTPSGAVMLSASAVDAMLKAKGYRDGTLFTRIREAAENHAITQEMAEWAHGIRLEANDERHADEDARLPTQHDAARCVEFALALGEFMFVLPARVQRGRSANGSDEGGPTPAQMASGG